VHLASKPYGKGFRLMQFVGASLLSHGSALRRVDPDEASECADTLADTINSMRSVTSTSTKATSGIGNGDAEALAARVAKLEGLIATSAEPTSPGSGTGVVAEQIDALREALADERRERQMAHSALLKSIEALGLEDVTASVSSFVMQKMMDEIALVVSEQSAKMEVTKVQLEARVHDVEAKYQGSRGELEALPRAMRDLQARFDSMQDLEALPRAMRDLQLRFDSMQDLQARFDSMQHLEALPQATRDLQARLDSMQAYIDTVQARVQAVTDQRLEAHRVALLQERSQERNAIATAAEQSVERGVAASTECTRMLSQMRSLFDAGTLCTQAQMEAKLQEKLEEERAEWKAAINEEHLSSCEATRSMGKTIGEEFERNIMAQAVAEARTEACTVACNVLTKELEAWQKERDAGCSRAELTQVTERVALTEQTLKDVTINVHAAAQGDKLSRSEGDVGNSIDIANLRETVVRLESRVSVVAAEVNRTHHSLQLEMANVRADVRRLGSVDTQLLQSNVAKLLMQSDGSRRELEHIELQSNDALQKEIQARIQGDQRIERACLEQLQSREARLAALQEDCKTQGVLLNDVWRYLSQMTRLQRQQMSPSDVEGLSENSTQPDSLDVTLPAKLQERLQALIAKMEGNCMEGLAPDLKQLNSLLVSSEGKAEVQPQVTVGAPVRQESLDRTRDRSVQRAEVRQQSASVPGGSLTPRAPPPNAPLPQGHQVQQQATSQEPNRTPRGQEFRRLMGADPVQVRAPSPGYASPDPYSRDRRLAPGIQFVQDTTKSTGSHAASSDHDEAVGSAQHLKDEILHYLRSEFQDQISETLKSMQSAQTECPTERPTIQSVPKTTTYVPVQLVAQTSYAPPPGCQSETSSPDGRPGYVPPGARSPLMSARGMIPGGGASIQVEAPPDQLYAVQTSREAAGVQRMVSAGGANQVRRMSSRDCHPRASDYLRVATPNHPGMAPGAQLPGRSLGAAPSREPMERNGGRTPSFSVNKRSMSPHAVSRTPAAGPGSMSVPQGNALQGVTSNGGGLSVRVAAAPDGGGYESVTIMQPRRGGQ
jgi:hypothetical protein